MDDTDISSARGLCLCYRQYMSERKYCFNSDFEIPLKEEAQWIYTLFLIFLRSSGIRSGSVLACFGRNEVSNIGHWNVGWLWSILLQEKYTLRNTIVPYIYYLLIMPLMSSNQGMSRLRGTWWRRGLPSRTDIVIRMMLSDTAFILGIWDYRNAHNVLEVSIGSHIWRGPLLVYASTNLFYSILVYELCRLLCSYSCVVQRSNYGLTLNFPIS